MPHSSDSSDSSSFSQSPPPSKQDSSDDMRKVQRREKNRIAAQKSRLRQTQKADTLHLRRWFPRLLAGSSESLLSRAMTGFLWQVVFWLKTAVIQAPSPRPGGPGSGRAACVRGSEKAWAGADPVTSRKPGPGIAAGAASIALARPGPARLQEGGFAQGRLGAKFTGNVSFVKLCGAERLGEAPPPPEVLYATHSFHQPHISSPRFQH
ncbi:PREDICTED: basic leucine zipper transcriptional factor ATF-like [Chaetura pelagica]|uniref:basic leucine zipper transcriptional factor ATF-like n=1 Tax=Chaetura pelagica TaxID=8897 RepID=UPI0005232A9B|nr:PREDICTED: basic leucine zipper transcriptional factor ATF-like [Chaetura pelagica]